MSAHIASVIANAVSKGFTARSILQYLSRNFPQYASAISNATAMGYAADKVLKHLVDPRGKNPDNSDQYLTDSEKADKNDKERKRKVAMGLGATALAAGGGLAGLLGSGVASITPEVLPALSNETKLLSQSPEINISPKQLPPPPTPQLPAPPQPLQPGPSLGLQMQQQAQAPIANAMQPPPAAQMAQAAQATPRDPMKNIALAKNLGVDVQIKNLIDGNLSPERIETALKSWLSKEKYAALQSAEGGIQGLIEDVATLPSFKLQPTIKNQEQQAPVEIAQETLPFESKTAEAEAVKEQEPKPIKKGSTVSTPHGIGEVKAISGDKAIVKVDGKAQKVDVENLEQSPISEKDMGDLWNDLKQQIQKDTGQEISRNVEFAGYDPNVNELMYKPYLGSAYIYKDISPEDASFLTSVLTKRKTTGENFIGGWEKDTKSPIGAAMSKLIQRLQSERGGKGNEYSRKFQTIYSATEPAQKASKQKYEEQKKKKVKNEKRKKPKT